MQLFADDDLAQPSRLIANHERMLLALADIGCGKHLLAAFLSLDNAHQDHIRFLTGPIVQHRSPWADTTPEWLCEAVTADRLRIILQEPAAAPLSMDYSDIYLWAAAQATARHTGKTVAEIWSSIGGDPVEDRLIVDPSGRYHYAYRQLCGDIRRRVVKAASASSGTAKSPAPDPAVVTEQLSLF